MDVHGFFTLCYLLHNDTDSRKGFTLVLLDLIAAFETVDHTLLLDRLENCVGFSGTALSRFDRNYFITVSRSARPVLILEY